MPSRRPTGFHVDNDDRCHWLRCRQCLHCADAENTNRAAVVENTRDDDALFFVRRYR